MRFQSSPRIAAGRVADQLLLFRKAGKFQSSPRIAAGRVSGRQIADGVCRVSILAPHRCGARHFFAISRRNSFQFQSSPRIAAGRVSDQIRRGITDNRFNPRPASLRGASRDCRHDQAYGIVSILAPHRCGARPRCSSGSHICHRVSILAPHRCGARRSLPVCVGVVRRRFNPRPASLRGASESTQSEQRKQPVSILAPHRCGARLELILAYRCPSGVSILAPHRCGARLRHNDVRSDAVPVSILAPHRCGARRASHRDGRGQQQFQSSPRIAAGRVDGVKTPLPVKSCFNPRPASLRGASFSRSTN